MNTILENMSLPDPHVEKPAEDIDFSVKNRTETLSLRRSEEVSEIEFLIIGAGPTGLGAAYKLKKEGISNFIVVDRAPQAGGLASSFLDPKGFWWDVGGHVQFSHYHQFDTAMQEAIPSDQWLQHQRVSAVRIYDRFVPYFFQNNIGFLPEEARDRCLQGLEHLAKNPITSISNFKEWIEASFGRGIADEFMIPYNFKVWAYPPEELNHTWVGDRVATVDLERIKKNILESKADVSWGPNSTFGFPLQGGTGQIWRSLSGLLFPDLAYKDDSVKFNTNVTSINPKAHLAELNTGETIKYKHLISTMPLDKLVETFTTTEESLKNLPIELNSLKHSSTHIIGIGLEGRPSTELEEMCWMYFPEPKSDFYRVTLFSKYSPNNVPDSTKCYSLMCEVSESPVKRVNKASLVKNAVQGLLNTGLISPTEKVVSTWQYSVRYGYPTPSVERDKVLATVVPALDKLDIYSRGRFGGWKYEVGNQDHSFAQGYEIVQRILEDRPEFTYGTEKGYDPNSLIKGGKKLDLESREIR